VRLSVPVDKSEWTLQDIPNPGADGAPLASRSGIPAIVVLVVVPVHGSP